MLKKTLRQPVHPKIEGNPTSLLCDAKSLEPSKKNNTSEMFQDRTEDLVAGTAKNSSHSSQCASDAMKDSVPVSLVQKRKLIRDLT
ncbi:uncharacterized protein PgNI_11622 [Pyricularia grisea]|uniref:Uncharacterized protein n=1 Tax=Pyricularia grisea TaxID=148305 RepID=A0A6P8ANY6_PYRGI|nr:uncharacterized protein PgNI_11622 [Pyricularia grisea]TLD03738.1 hypothetical protein PgNI_11622 [Pyricularia grisea]